MRKLPPFLALILIALSVGCRPYVFFGTFSYGLSDHLRKAERLTRQEKYAEAIAEYESHIEYRLQSGAREKWENPYFYYLIIGDLYLRMEKVDDALTSYETAEKHGVDEGLLSDRFRLVAKWLSERDRRDEALEVLEKYRDRDPLLFDLMLDRIAREMVSMEDKKGSTSTNQRSQESTSEERQ